MYIARHLYLLMFVAIDFETYYDDEITIKSTRNVSLSVEKYLEILFERKKYPYLVSIYKSETENYCGSIFKCNWDLLDTDERIIVAHNVGFDKIVYQYLVMYNLAPEKYLNYKWRCTADMAAYLKSPRSLKEAVFYLLGITVDKEPREKMKGKDFDKLSEESQKEIMTYCLQDAKYCWQLYNTFRNKWPEVEQEISAINTDAGNYGVRVDVKLLEEMMESLAKDLFDLEKEVPWRNTGNPETEKPILSIPAVAAECRKIGIPPPLSIAIDSQDFEDWYEQYKDKVPWIKALQSYRRLNILYRRLKVIKEQIINKDILPFRLLYFGAHTGRFSGSNSNNMQNLPTRNIEKYAIRKIFIARPNKKLCIVDWCQIEPRILFWLAKDAKMLQRLSNGENIYEAFARLCLNYNAPTPLKTTDKTLYLAAKSMVLGLGYGCGAKNFIHVAKSLAGLELTYEQAHHYVTLYRTGNPLVVQFWAQLDNAIRLAFIRKTPLTLKLPSGRDLTYFDIHYIDNRFKAKMGYDGKRESIIHGPRLTENLCQAIARDVFAQKFLDIKKAGIQLLFHVHDEYVLEVPMETTEEDIRKILLQPVKWLPHCPLDIEVTFADNYDVKGE